MNNETQNQQNKVEDLLIEENALKNYKEHLKRQVLAVPHLKESQQTKDTIKERIETMIARTALLLSKKTQQILNYENIPG